MNQQNQQKTEENQARDYSSPPTTPASRCRLKKEPSATSHQSLDTVFLVPTKHLALPPVDFHSDRSAKNLLECGGLPPLLTNSRFNAQTISAPRRHRLNPKILRAVILFLRALW
jgi:hypothetical protein